MPDRCSLQWLLGICAFAMASTAGAEAIRVRADPWLPYSGGQEMDPPGYMVEMAETIAKANGHELEYRTLPWKNALQVVREGNADCVVGAYRSDAEDFAFPDVGWGPSGNVFWGLAEQKWRYRDMTSLDSIKIGVLEDYSYGEELDAYIEQHKADAQRVEVVPAVGRGIVRLLARLIGRRVGTIIEDRNVLAYALEQSKMEPGRVISLGEAGEAESVYIACTPAHPRGKEYAQMFAKGTLQLRASGKLAEILAKYNLNDWEGAER